MESDAYTLTGDGGEISAETVDICQEENNGSPSGGEAFVNTLRAIFPPSNKFERKFKNPCWYMHINIHSHIQKMLRQKNMTDSQASYVLSQILPTEEVSQRELVCVPKVFMIGFPRTSSTHLYDILMQHPKMAPGLYKEPHWWTRLPFKAQFPHNILSIVRYILHYHPATKYIQYHPQALTIDASQSTIWDRSKLCDTPNIIHSVIPQAKYIVLMREPVSRLFSDYTYLCNYLQEHREVDSLQFISQFSKAFHQAALKEMKTFEQCMRNMSLEICTNNTLGPRHDGACGRVRLGVSLYHVHVSRWLKVIPRDQFLFLRTEDLAADPYAVLQKVWRFLELPAQSQDVLSNILYEHSNSNHLTSVKIDPETRKILEQFFQSHNEKLAHLLSDEKFLWKASS